MHITRVGFKPMTFAILELCQFVRNCSRIARLIYKGHWFEPYPSNMPVILFTELGKVPGIQC